MLPNPQVTIPTIKKIIAHFQSPLNKGTKKPKIKLVHENPTGASFNWFDLLFSNDITAKAI